MESCILGNPTYFCRDIKVNISLVYSVFSRTHKYTGTESVRTFLRIVETDTTARNLLKECSITGENYVLLSVVCTLLYIMWY